MKTDNLTHPGEAAVARTRGHIGKRAGTPGPTVSDTRGNDATSSDILFRGARVSGDDNLAIVTITADRYHVSDYGAVGDGVTDDTAAIQAAVDAAAAAGGGVIYFPPGHYIIGGALQDTGAFNGQLLLPDQSTSDQQITIRFLGASRPPLAVHGPIPTAGYSILESTLTGASGTAAVISGGNGGYPIQTNVQVVIEDLICLAPSDPTMTWWNLSCTQGGRITGLYVSTVTDWVGTRVEPTHSNSYGIKLPGYGESNYTQVDGLIVCGFYTGYKHGELTVAQGLGFAFCIVAVELGFTAGHGSMIVSMHQTACQYGIKVVDETWCDILLYDAEHWTSPSWADTVYDVDDGSDLLHGSLRWFGVAVGGSPDHVFDINGGANVSYTEVGEAPSPGGGGGGLVLLEQHTASTSASLDFTSAITSTYDEYLIEFVNVIPATNGAVLWMRMSTNGGSSYDSGTNYDYTSGYAYSGGVGVGSSATSSTKILLMDGVSNSSNYGITGHIRLFSPLSTALYKQILGQLMRSDSSGLGLVMLNAMGVYKSTTAADAVQFLMDSGNIASGTIRVYGVAK